MKPSTEAFLKEINEVCKKYKKDIDVGEYDKLCVFDHEGDGYLDYLLKSEDLTEGDE